MKSVRDLYKTGIHFEECDDKIFYYISDSGLETYDDISVSRLETFDAIKECAKDIYHSQEYKEYEKKFYEEVKLPKLIEKYQERFEEYFENVEIEGISVNSEVSDQPINDEIFQGAKNRVKNLKEYAEMYEVQKQYYQEKGVTT